ncbi:alpha-amylase family glycosyl hydrolase [Brevundimonas sp.]|uniref:alpha-amylase family glycosyl hydrolase n=1 Tax=Brevundimonas sp. TaxID=1871086 RepID=UPI0037838456
MSNRSPDILFSNHVRDHPSWSVFEARFQDIYGSGPERMAVLARITDSLADALRTRSTALVELDRARSAAPDWTSVSGNVIYTFYVDRFSQDLAGLIERLDYLQSLGVRWLHPLPLLRSRPGDSDGGFAVADFRQIEPHLGSMDDLAALTTALHQRGMGLLLDVVCNHTAREHAWAVAARAGDLASRAFYRVESTETSVAAWGEHLIDVFPDTAPGSFTHEPEMGGWVWTTFYPFQWDLNYANPAVFIEMLDVLLFLANQGVDGFRLDSAPFLWKREGTSCRNQPEAYRIVEAWRAALSIVVPGVVLLAEAIESIDDVLPFFGQQSPGCDLAYNNGVMTALWGALADEDAGIARTLIEAASVRPAHAAWLNYVRCHDDLIWNALAAYAEPADLKRWSDFYAGGGFSGGRAFQTAPGGVPSTNGMAAALVGLGRDGVDQDLAARRLTLLYGIIHGLDGWPLIYMGDEVALGNDEAFDRDPARRDEGRWLHRPVMDWYKAEGRDDPDRIEGRTFAALRRFGKLSRSLDGLDIRGPARPVALTEKAVLAFERFEGSRRLLVLANLSPRGVVADLPPGWAGGGHDLVSGRDQSGPSIMLEPYDLLWLADRT